MDGAPGCSRFEAEPRRCELGFRRAGRKVSEGIPGVAQVRVGAEGGDSSVSPPGEAGQGG